MIRKLILHNRSKTDVFDFQNDNHILHSISGLGSSQKLGIISVPTGTKFINSQNKSNTSIEGVISFDSYGEYDNFVEFLARNRDELFLTYSVPIGGVYKTSLAKVMVSRLTKTEIGAGRRLSSQIRIVRLTNWLEIYFKTSKVIELHPTATYPRTYPYTYIHQESAAIEFLFEYSGNHRVWVDFEFSPDITIPIVEIVDIETGAIVGKLEAISDLTEGLTNVSKIIIRPAIWERAAFVELNNGTKKSVLNKLSIEPGVKNFISLQKGVYRIKVSDDATETGDRDIDGIVKIEMKEEKI